MGAMITFTSELYAQGEAGLGPMEGGERMAILMVHFGSTHRDTQEQSLARINARVQSAFPGVNLREAYSSRIVLKRLRERGEVKPTPLEALTQLRSEGYTHILVQPSFLLHGEEMEALRNDVRAVAHLFDEVRLGSPILSEEKDYQSMIDFLCDGAEQDALYLWVGHGTQVAATAQYAMLDHMLLLQGKGHIVIGCIEGYPHYSEALKRLRGQGATTGVRGGKPRVVLRPLLLTAGEHAKNDISIEWRQALEREGYRVEVIARGLGEYEAIQRMIVDRVRYIFNHRPSEISVRKRIYESTPERK